MEGKVWSVQYVTSGGELAVDAPTGSTELVLVDAADFDEDGGSLKVHDIIGGYTSVDMDTDTISLAEAMPEDAFAGDRVRVDPEARTMTALVRVAGAEDAIEARVVHSLESVLDVGIREDDSEAETVVLEGDGYGYQVVDVVGRDAQVSLLRSSLVQVGTDGSETVGIVDEFGNTIASMDSLGRFTGKGASLGGSEPIYDESDGSLLEGVEIYGTEFTEWFTGPKGLVVYGNNGATQGPFTSETGQFHVRATLLPLRAYRIGFRADADVNDSNIKFYFTLRVEIGPDGGGEAANPTVSSPVLMTHTVATPGAPHAIFSGAATCVVQTDSGAGVVLRGR